MNNKYEFQELTKNLKNMREGQDFDEFFERICRVYDFDKLVEKILEQYEFHEVAELFPIVSKDDMKNMARDIFEKGLIDKITTFEEKIIDGRNRIIACALAGVELRFESLPDSFTPEDYAISKNVMRRQLKSAQKVELGLQLIKKEKQEQQIIENAIEKLKKEEEDPIIKKAIRAREITLLKKTAKTIGTSRESLEKGQIIKERAREDPKVAKAWVEAKKGQKSVDEVYKKATGEPIKVKQEPTTAQINQKLREALNKWREKYYALKASYDALEKKFNKLKNNLKMLIEGNTTIIEDDNRKKKTKFPTVKELREAELI